MLAYLAPFVVHYGLYALGALAALAALLLLFGRHGWWIAMAAVMITLMCSCQHTLVRKGADGSLTISDGSAASKSAYEETTITVPGLGTVTKKTWAKDETEVPRKWMFWGGMPKMLDSVGGVAGDVANGVDKVIK
jgi:hypothetical protein